MTQELKPCPFCNGRLKPWGASAFIHDRGKCILSGRKFAKGFIDQWNTRADLPPKVKPLVWGVHPVGLVAGSSYGSSYLIDTHRKRANIIKGLTFSQEFETVEQAKGAAQADYEQRILSALESM